MICITGDIHGDLKRFKHPLLRKLKKNDALIVCGDFGFIWDGSKREQKTLKKLGKKRYNILFVEGCHENYDILEAYPSEQWCGGDTRIISGKLRQLKRGQVFEIAGKKIFAFGGGYMSENEKQVRTGKWWVREIPTDQELEWGIKNLEKCGNAVDYVVTHEPPSLIKEFMNIGITDRTHLNTYLNDLRVKIKFDYWFFGKTHVNKLIPPKYYSMFNHVIMIDKTKIKNKKGRAEIGREAL